MKKFLKYLLPYQVKNFLKKIYYTGLDFVDMIKGAKDRRYPPRRLNFVGSSEFKKIGEDFLVLFREKGHIQRDDNVLDIGCGIGRMALPLTTYLSPKGKYTGFDIVKKGIEWCQKHITPDYPNFTFLHADIKNTFYNKKGKILSEQFHFPAENGQYDFCFATSVFTHMLPAEIINYIKESSRVIKKNGKIFFTFFLIPPGSPEKYSTDFVKFQYRFKNTAYYSHHNCIEAEVGYSEEWVKDVLQQNGFSDICIYPGTWKDPAGLSYQDIIIAGKL